MSQETEDHDDEMTDLEREIVIPRVVELEDEDKCSVGEFLQDF